MRVCRPYLTLHSAKGRSVSMRSVGIEVGFKTRTKKKQNNFERGMELRRRNREGISRQVIINP